MVTCSGVVRVVVDGPVAALAGVVSRSGYLSEGLVQRQVVPDGVLERHMFGHSICAVV